MKKKSSRQTNSNTFTKKHFKSLFEVSKEVRPYIAEAQSTSQTGLFVWFLSKLKV